MADWWHDFYNNKLFLEMWSLSPIEKNNHKTPQGCPEQQLSRHKTLISQVTNLSKQITRFHRNIRLLSRDVQFPLIPLFVPVETEKACGSKGEGKTKKNYGLVAAIRNSNQSCPFDITWFAQARCFLIAHLNRGSAAVLPHWLESPWWSHQIPWKTPLHQPRIPPLGSGRAVPRQLLDPAGSSLDHCT